ncbi:MAG: malonyl-[acyl-carrier protein] O-methyltransferase BioC [Gammaproteobacteria bacterium]|nr:MAG: malonyl-[acyl-carrier protein] O-methyltransferase BioC [Gammaproteobacteria bacterium]
MSINSSYLRDIKDIQSSFNGSCKTYQQSATLQAAYADELCQRLKCIKKTPKTILDLGAGDGSLSKILQQQYPKSVIYNLDLAQKSLFFHKCKNSICADAHYLPFKKNSFDLIVSGFMLQWCDNLPQVFQEIYNSLKKDGLFMFSTFGTRTLEELRYAWDMVDKDVHINIFFDIEHYGNLLQSAGFANVAVDRDLITEYEKNVISLMRRLKSMGAHNINQGRKKSLTGKNKIKKLQKFYETMQAKQGLPVSFDIIMAIGWKL